jgi:hypothetical protein
MLRTLLVVRRNRVRVGEQGGMHASCRARVGEVGLFVEHEESEMR